MHAGSPTHLRSRRRLLLLAAVALATVAACTTTSELTGPSTDVVTTPPTTQQTDGTATSTAPSVPTSLPVRHEVVDGFDDHTLSEIRSVDEFFALASSDDTGQSVVKFSIPEMGRSTDVRWLDSNFYALHDEWYWFRLLNGQRVPGFATGPVAGHTFATVDEIVDWAAQQPRLPLDLQFIDSRARGRRLYSPTFYRDGMPDDRRNYGIGTVIHFPNAADGDDHWLMELEFSDSPSPDEVSRYFELLASTLPSDIGDALEWVLRSPDQETTAVRMADEALPHADRIVRYSELVPTGEVAVYNPGIAVGQLFVVDGVTARLTDARDTDIVILEHAPDYLPPAAALITSDLQTPLAHVNLLALNRGIPNASVQGILDDPGVRQAARIRSFAVVRTNLDGTIEISLISRDQYDEWRTLGTPTPISVPPIDVYTTPTIVDLTDRAASITDETDLERWRPMIGGKATGFLTLLSAPGVTTPPMPLAISVNPYLRHVNRARTELDAMLADTDFQGSAAVRYLFLEGEQDYLEAYPDADDAALVDEMRRLHPGDSPLGRILAADGFKRMIRDLDMLPADLTEITDRIRATYADLDPRQGIRFRSSSSVEDIEGFNGAGLYDSNTGFLDPVAAGEDADKTIEEAIKKTWASYWGFEAFEERQREQISHLSGEMGVLVHPRFDDDLEVNNGVATYTLSPDGSGAGTASINVQLGAVAVANPDPELNAFPEVAEVERAADGSMVIERLATSTLQPDQPVLGDDAVRELVAQLDSTAQLWLDRTNASLPAAQRITTVTLDFEFKTVAEGWPALIDGALPSRLVVKQARSLDPGLRGVPDEVRALPIPRDVLARASSVRDTCGTVEVLTDPLLRPDMGHAVEPLVIDVPPAPDCAPRTLYASPQQFLVDLLADGAQLTLISG